MAFSHIFTRQCRDSSGTNIGGSETVTFDTELNFDGSIPGPSTNTEVDWACTVANLKSIILVSSVACTVKTNDSGSPQETITLAAGAPLIWTLANDGSGAIPFSGNVTKLYITVAGSTASAFKIRALADQTP